MVKLSLIAVPLAVVVAAMSASTPDTAQASILGGSALSLLTRLTEPGTLLVWGTVLAGLASVIGRHRK
jgi:hypothetical protein